MVLHQCWKYSHPKVGQIHITNIYIVHIHLIVEAQSCDHCALCFAYAYLFNFFLGTRFQRCCTV